jgi:hypothetical protein
MVHMVHHFQLLGSENQKEWCTPCTIYNIHSGKTGKNGAYDAPFLASEAGESREVVPYEPHV